MKWCGFIRVIARVVTIKQKLGPTKVAEKWWREDEQSLPELVQGGRRAGDRRAMGATTGWEMAGYSKFADANKEKADRFVGYWNHE